MKKIKYSLVFVLISLPLFSLFYKSQILNISLLPKAPTDSWILELSHYKEKSTLDSKKNLQSFRLPIPTSGNSQEVTYLKLSPTQNSNKTEAKALNLTAHLKLYGQEIMPSKTNNQLSTKDFTRYPHFPLWKMRLKSNLLIFQNL